MHALKMISFLIFGLKVSNGGDVEARLYAFNYTGTKCSSGLMVDMPLHLEGIVQLPGDIKEHGHYISIERKELDKKDFEQFDVIYKNCEVSEQFFCKPMGNTTVYAFYIHARATTALSESAWKFTGSYRGKNFESEVIFVPKIFNVADVKMTVNGQVWSLTNNSLNITTDELTICCIPGGAPWPCEAVVSMNSQPPVTNSPCVTHKLELSVGRKLVEIRFGFLVCGNDTFSQIYSPDVIVETKTVPENVSYNETWILLGVFGLLVVFVIVALFIIYIKGKLGQRKQATEQTREPFLPQQNQASTGSSIVSLECERFVNVGKSKKKGKKNKGKKPTTVAAPKTSRPATTRDRTLSEPETIRLRKVQDSRKMKTK